MMTRRSIESISVSILNSDAPEEEKLKVMKAVLGLGKDKTNVMLIGAEGCGKKSTINALSSMGLIKVGVDTGLSHIGKYELGNLVLWNCPGLEYGKEVENGQKIHIINKLQERDKKGNLLIDLVLVILDGCALDFEAAYEFINEIIMPNLGEDKDRILVALNKVDIALNGRYWNQRESKPKAKLLKYLDEKSVTVQKRIKEITGLDVAIICYSAGCTEGGQKHQEPYNISKLLYCINRFVLNKRKSRVIEGGIDNNVLCRWWEKIKNFPKNLTRRINQPDYISEGKNKRVPKEKNIPKNLT